MSAFSRPPSQYCAHCASGLNTFDKDGHPYRCFEHKDGDAMPQHCGRCGAILIDGRCSQHKAFADEYAALYFESKRDAEEARPEVHPTEEQLPEDPSVAQLAKGLSAEAFFFATLNAIAEMTKIRPQKILSRDRTKDVTHARRLVCALARKFMPSKMTYPTMGKLMGGRNHTSIIRLVREMNPEDSLRAQLFLQKAELALKRELIAQRAAPPNVREQSQG